MVAAVARRRKIGEPPVFRYYVYGAARTAEHRDYGPGRSGYVKAPALQPLPGRSTVTGNNRGIETGETGSGGG